MSDAVFAWLIFALIIATSAGVFVRVAYPDIIKDYQNRGREAKLLYPKSAKGLAWRVTLIRPGQAMLWQYRFKLVAKFYARKYWRAYKDENEVKMMLERTFRV